MESIARDVKDHRAWAEYQIENDDNETAEAAATTER